MTVIEPFCALNSGPGKGLFEVTVRFKGGTEC